MPLKLFVGITDRDWYELLRRLPGVDEVNFWAPGGTPFRALSPGELFLFKLHAPHHFIVGGGDSPRSIRRPPDRHRRGDPSKVDRNVVAGTELVVRNPMRSYCRGAASTRG